MANLKTATKVYDFLNKREEYVTPTTIHKETGINYNSVMASLQGLEKMNLLQYVTDGRIYLVSLSNKIKGVSNGNNR